MPLLNPLLVAMVVIIPFLLMTGISYEHYFAGSKVLNDLLQPAVVALAFPLYEQLHQIRARFQVGPTQIEILRFLKLDQDP
jgi:putative effector of murein hydrolase